eukprot:scaffold20530_cov68-Phaeocystis_antarctica.AAC.5
MSARASSMKRSEPTSFSILARWNIPDRTFRPNARCTVTPPMSRAAFPLEAVTTTSRPSDRQY